MGKGIFLFFTSIILLFSFGARNTTGASAVVDRVIAVVNNEIITLSDLEREESLRKTEGKQDERQLLEDMINRKLQMAEAKRAGLDVTDKELADALADIMKRNNLDGKQFDAALAREGLTLDQYKTDLREQMTLSRVFNKYVRSGVAIDEAEARAFYENNRKNYSLPEEIRMRQLFFRVADNATAAQVAAVKARAEAAYARAKKGEDFVRLVKELSENENAAEGGDLGFMQRDQVIPEIQEAVKTLKPGEISTPFQCAGGFQVIRLEEIRDPAKPFEKAKDEIMKTLYEQKIENTYRGWLQTLRSDSHIENRL
ncbi:MAG TPA: peptidyl-prolyl cis-trans isomerase [Nitrospirota bacterium]